MTRKVKGHPSNIDPAPTEPRPHFPSKIQIFRPTSTATSESADDTPREPSVTSIIPYNRRRERAVTNKAA